MVEQHVQGGEQEGASQETPSQTPGTEAPQGLTREEAKQLINQSVEDARRHDQSVRDRQMAELRRDFQQRQAEVEPREDYEDDLLAQAGYPQQPQQPQYAQAQDPTTGQWYQYQVQQDPYAQQRATVERRRDRRIQTALRKQQEEIEEIRRQRALDDMVAGELRSVGVSGNDPRLDWATNETFQASLSRIKAEKQEAEIGRRVREEVEKRSGEIRQEQIELIRQSRERGEIEYLEGGPSVPVQSQETLRAEYTKQRQALAGSGDFVASNQLKEKYRGLGLEI